MAGYPSSPCTRRDGPFTDCRPLISRAFSLHAQGWPTLVRLGGWPVTVLPARAGMARRVLSLSHAGIGSPCTRRDGPFGLEHPSFFKRFSLHAQGWPDDENGKTDAKIVLPARAGMALKKVQNGGKFFGSPCTRRDGPTPQSDGALALRSPCTRRDGPSPPRFLHRRKSFSLHAQGWPFHSRIAWGEPWVLPARAGMARCLTGSGRGRYRSPCTRRDGPRLPRLVTGRAAFSLHAQGWPTGA